MAEKSVWDELEELTLVNIRSGIAVEMFDQELQRVLPNIRDLNTDPKAKRSVTLKVTFTPWEERNGMDIEIQASSKLAAVKAEAAQAFVGEYKGKVVAVCHDPQQLQMKFDEESELKKLERKAE